MVNIFLSYRREDTSRETSRIYQSIAEEFGEDRVFMDVNDIPLGASFPEYLLEMLGWANIVLVIVGRNWLTSRLFNFQDYVRKEIETSFFLSGETGATIAPVIIDNARMPTSDQLPPSIRELPRLNGFNLCTGSGFQSSISELFQRLRSFPRQKRAAKPGSSILNQGINTTSSCYRYTGRISGPQLPADATIRLRKKSRRSAWESSVECPSDSSRATYWQSFGSQHLIVEEAAGAMIEWFNVGADKIQISPPGKGPISIASKKNRSVKCPNPVFTSVANLVLQFDDWIHSQERIYICDGIPYANKLIESDYSLMGHTREKDTFGTYLFSLTRDLGGCCKQSKELVFFPTWPETNLQYLNITPPPLPDVKCCAHVGQDKMGYHLAYCR